MIKNLIENKLQAAFSPMFLEVKDESPLHRGHSHYKPGGESHFSITIISSMFCGLTRIQRHQKVYACLEKELKKDIHALRLKTLCPEDVEVSSALE